MYASLNKRKENENERDGHLHGQKRYSKIIDWLKRSEAKDIRMEPILRSQVILFDSRKRWGLLFALATISGLFCVPLSSNIFLNGYLGSGFNDVPILEIFLLPLSTLLIITGMYVFNDLMDADLDRANGKTKRPIPSGKVPKSHAIIFIIAINLIGISIPALMGNMVGLLFISFIALIGILYSVPKISLKDKFVIKTLAIAFAMMCALLLGSSKYLDIVLSSGGGSVLVPISAGVIIALMVFVTSPLNDLGDVAGDKEAGRRTIPIVIGSQNTVWLSFTFVLGIAIIAWSIYASEILSYSDNETTRHTLSSGKIVLPLAISFVSILTIIHLLGILKQVDNLNFVRNSVTKKSMPLHMLLQFSLAIGCLLL